MRVVLDANVFVSAVITNGSPHRIFQHWLGGSVLAVIRRSQLATSATLIPDGGNRASLKPEQRRKISVVVLDVTKP